ncbi:MAG: hypothetical protein J6P12_09695 [Methanobrevibacter sp.]|nr:hypothetical protein [Methanobrevibacter sp.]
MTSELIEEKIESSKIRHRTLVEDILSGKIPYNETAYLDSKHNTTKSKDLD